MISSHWVGFLLSRIAQSQNWHASNLSLLSSKSCVLRTPQRGASTTSFYWRIWSFTTTTTGLLASIQFWTIGGSGIKEVFFSWFKQFCITPKSAYPVNLWISVGQLCRPWLTDWRCNTLQPGSRFRTGLFSNTYFAKQLLTIIDTHLFQTCTQCFLTFKIAHLKTIYLVPIVSLVCN